MAATLNYTVTNAGANIVLDGTTLSDGTIVTIYAATGVVLASNWHLEISPVASNGTTIYFNIAINAPLDLNGNTFDINGTFIDQASLTAGAVMVGSIFFNSALVGGQYFQNYYYLQTGVINGDALIDASLTLAKFPAQTRGYIIVGDATARPALLNAKTNAQILIGDGTDLVSVPVTGDIAITNAGVTSIAAGVIVNADINASAAIALSKLAALTASQVAVTTAGGVITTSATLSPTLGGTGQDFSASTGFLTVAAGTVAASTISEVITLMVSFEAAGGTQASVGDFKIKMPYAGTVTEIYAYATKAIAATDNGTIVPKNNGGTTMTAGTVTFTASDARGTAYTTTPSANNTFVAGDLLTFTTAKVTAGGIVQLSIKVTRTS